MFGAIVQDHVQNRRNCGPLEGATHYGVAGAPGDGPHMELWLEVEGDRVIKAAYSTYGCFYAVACGSMTAQIVTGRSVAEAAQLNERDIGLLLGGIPEGKKHCQALAITALRKALNGSEEAGGPNVL